MPRATSLDPSIYWKLGLIALLAIAALHFAHYLPWQWAVQLAEHIATAILIACFLGLTIDLWLKKQLTEDVFSAAMGYELPEDLKQEVRYVYGNKLLCKHHQQNADIVDLGNGFVSITIGVERTIENIGETPQTLHVAVGMDEWFVPSHPSQLLECSYVKNGVHSDVSLLKTEKRDAGFRTEYPEDVKLAPKESITVYTKMSETKPRNGDHFFAFSCATNGPAVTVSAPPDIGWNVHFTHRHPADIGKYSNTYTLNGLLLPHQAIRIHWWDKKANEAWKQTPFSTPG